MTDVLIEAIAELTRQSREMAAEIANLKYIVRLHDERIDANGLLLTTSHRRDVVRHYEAQADRIKREAA